MAGKVGPAHGDADAIVAAGQRQDQMAAEETGAAENRDQGVVLGLEGHGSSAWRRVPAPPNTARAGSRPEDAMASIDKAKAATLCVLACKLPVPGWRNW